MAEGGCLLSQFHCTYCRYFLGHVACRNLPWQGLLNVVNNISDDFAIGQFQVLKFILGSEAQGNKTKEIALLFVIFRARWVRKSAYLPIEENLLGYSNWRI